MEILKSPFLADVSTIGLHPSSEDVLSPVDEGLIFAKEFDDVFHVENNAYQSAKNGYYQCQPAQNLNKRVFVQKLGEAA